MTTKEEIAPRPEQLGTNVNSAKPLWKTLGWAALSGLLLAGALPNLDWGWMAWFALVPLLAVFPLKNTRTAVAHGVTLAAFYSLGMVYWVAVFAAHLIGPALSVLGWALLTLCESFFFAVWAAGAQWLCRQSNSWAWRLGAPALWVIAAEWWRQLGSLGLSWGDLAYTQHLALPILQITKLTGIWGLSFLIVLVNVALTEIVKTRLAGKFSAAVSALVALTLVYGIVALRTENLRPAFVAAALQGNIDESVQQTPAYTERVMQVYEAQSQEAAARGAALTVWPETAYPGYLLNSNDQRARIGRLAVSQHQTMVIGSVEYDWGKRKNANSLFLMDARGNITSRYQKRQLVPFGEYVPGRDWFPALDKLHVTPADMEAGADTQPLMDGGPLIGKIGAALCFESSYARLTREQAARGAGLLVVSTDDTWFGHTSEVRQHSAIAAVRAAETDRYLIRSAATGISQILDPTGRVLAQAGLNRPAVVSAPVQSRTTLTLYVRWGDWFVGFCALLLAGVSVRWPTNARVRRAGTSRN